VGSVLPTSTPLTQQFLYIHTPNRPCHPERSAAEPKDPGSALTGEEDFVSMKASFNEGINTDHVLRRQYVHPLDPSTPRCLAPLRSG